MCYKDSVVSPSYLDFLRNTKSHKNWYIWLHELNSDNGKKWKRGTFISFLNTQGEKAI